MTRQLLALLIVASPMAATAVLTVTIQHTDAVCTYATGSAFAIASGGAPPYTYQWSNGATGTGILDVPAVAMRSAQAPPISSMIPCSTVCLTLHGMWMGCPPCSFPTLLIVMFSPPEEALVKCTR